jgi:hypothetical protein
MPHQCPTNDEGRQAGGTGKVIDTISRMTREDEPLFFDIGGALVGHSSFPAKAILPGSFNPLHLGHVTLAVAAAKRLGLPVHFELSVTNADKAALAPEEVERRVAQFAGLAPVWVTRAPVFEKKADIFPGAAFVLGYDTAVRVIDPKYYGGLAGRDAALRKMLARGCRLVVGGRLDATGVFRIWDGGGLAAEFDALFVVLSEADFRADVSSSQLRGK